MINILANLYKEGFQYRSLNAYRSAISSVHDKVDGYEVGQHPLVSRLLKGVFNTRPPQPRYNSTWDASIVLTWMEGLGENEDLSLSDLTLKLVMLLSLTRPSGRPGKPGHQIPSVPPRGSHFPPGCSCQTGKTKQGESGLLFSKVSVQP